MKLVCPACGAIASAESWINDANCRETLAIISRLPAPLPKTTLAYLSLFRAGKRALTWKKALRLAGEVEALTSKGFISVRGRIDRNCPPRIWAAAMEQMVEQRGSLTLPLGSHRYMIKVAYDMAQKIDHTEETAQRKREITGTGRTQRKMINPQSLNPFDQYIQGLRDTEPTRQEIDDWKKRRLK